MDFKFTNDYPAFRLDEIVSYLLGPRLWIPQVDYPDFSNWVEKVYEELKTDKKRAFVAFSGGNVVGVTVYQQHKKFKEVLEIKNLTVRPDMQGRYIANFLLRNSEIEGAKEFRSKYILCDAKARNYAIRLFLLKNRYKVLGKSDLYNLNSGDDLIYQKLV